MATLKSWLTKCAGGAVPHECYAIDILGGQVDAPWGAVADPHSHGR